MEVNKIYTGNCLEELKKLPNESVDCVVTSPPYWALRHYGVEGQLGLEPTFQEYINKLCDIFDEVKRVLKKEGTCWVNVGDTYGTQGGQNRKTDKDYSKYDSIKLKNREIGSVLLKEPNMHKNLCNIPARFSIEMQNRGWILRNEIIWHKPNCMPSSAKDRFTVDFEKIFFFVKQPMGYYFEQQLEPYTKPLDRWGGTDLDANGKSEWDEGTGQSSYRKRNMRPNEDGKNMRTVWSINTEPNSEAHFATYPQRLVERMIKAGCPENGLVIDPFFGSGTTGIYARKVNRNFVGIELNPEYVEIANKRLFKELGMFA